MLGSGGSVSGLTQKGYGRRYSSASRTLSYANVESGSAPEAGDLVVWFWLASDDAAAFNDLTSSGWAQGSAQPSNTGACMLAKVVVAGDISSPATILTGSTTGAGFWVAYTISGTIASLSISAISVQSSGSSAPSNQTKDSSALNAPDIAITIGAGGGDDGSPSMAMSGATADIDFTTGANVWNGSWESQFLVDLAVGGANITFSKGDDGSGNHMASGFVTVDF
jgi:hypothetical protein